MPAPSATVTARAGIEKRAKGIRTQAMKDFKRMKKPIWPASRLGSSFGNGSGRLAIKPSSPLLFQHRRVLHLVFMRMVGRRSRG